MLDRVDGLVLVGGDDIDPAQYGAESHPLTDPPNVRRDASELGLLRGAIERGMPVLGVCRGVQLLKPHHEVGETLPSELPQRLALRRKDRSIP